MNISLSGPDIGELEIQYVTSVLRSHQLSQGPWLGHFERQFAEYVGSRHAIAANSGTSALHLCVRALGIGAGDEVITTAFSFVASVNCLLYEGAVPAFTDTHPRTLNLDPDEVRKFLVRHCRRTSNGTLVDIVTRRTVKAILPVHIFGLPCDMGALAELAREYDLLLLEDACEALGAKMNGRHVGTIGDAAVFAFYPNKQMTTGEGGMIVTNDSQVADLCRSLRNQGRDFDGRWLTHVRLGYNYRMSELHAALGVAQLERITDLLTRRAEVARRYSHLLAGCEGLELPVEVNGFERSWFVYVVRFTGESPKKLRDAVRTHLQDRGISTQVYFPAIHRQPFFQQFRIGAPASLPHTERAADSCLALPFSSRLSDREIQVVCEEIGRALGQPLRGGGANPERAMQAS
jgi:dTDP-4-amino-4,6-dideoxygalactose transaminase